MGWTKQQLVLKAFGATGIVEYDGTDVQPEMLQDGLSSLDAMMAEWDSKGIRLGYLGSETPTDGDLGQDSGIPIWSVRAVYTNLAIELAGSIGREVSPKIAGIAERSYLALSTLYAVPKQAQFPRTMPIGAGHKLWRTGFAVLDNSGAYDPITGQWVCSSDDIDGGADTIDTKLGFS